MERLSTTLQTLYADLVQQVYAAGERPGSVYTQTDKGAKYLYAKYAVGSTRRDVYLGPENDPATQTRAQSIAAAQDNARERRRIVRTLRDSGVPVPGRELGNVLDAVSDAGLFHDAVLVGTAAYICYSPIVSVRLPSGALTTRDADLATATLAIEADAGSGNLLDILQRADKSFAPIPSLRKGASPASFRSQGGFLVDLLTQTRRRGDAGPVLLEHLDAGATPLQHVDWLIADPVRAVALHGHGVAVAVPQPARYAIHKLIIAQKRAQHERTKRGKDLLQARTLIEALSMTDPYALSDALEEACSMGTRGWKQPAQRSLKELEIEIGDPEA